MTPLPDLAAQSPVGIPLASMYTPARPSRNPPRGPTSLTPLSQPPRTQPSAQEEHIRAFIAVSETNRNALAQHAHNPLASRFGPQFTRAPEGGFPHIELLNAAEPFDDLDTGLLSRWFQIPGVKILARPFDWTGDNHVQTLPVLTESIRSTISNIASATLQIDATPKVSPPSPPNNFPGPFPCTFLIYNIPDSLADILLQERIWSTHVRNSSLQHHHPPSPSLLPGRFHYL